MEKKMKKNILLSVLAVLSMVCTVITIMGQQRTDEVPTESFSNLTLRVSIAKQDFLPFEPVPLTLMLSNDTPFPVIGYSQLRFDGNHIELLVTNENGKAIKISDLSPVRCKCEKPRDVQIEAGQKFQERGVFYNFPKAFLISGTYEIQVIFYDADRQNEIKSEPITIRITEPTGAEVEAYNFLKIKMEKNGFLLSGLGNQEIYDELATRFSGTLYSDYGALIISGKYLAGGDYEKAESLLQRAAQRENFALKEEVIKALNRVNELKRQDKPQ